MMQSNNISVFISLICIVLLGSCNEKRELIPEEWDRTYYNNSKLPYGTSLVYSFLDSIAEKKEQSRQPIINKVIDLLEINDLEWAYELNKSDKDDFSYYKWDSIYKVQGVAKMYQDFDDQASYSDFTPSAFIFINDQFQMSDEEATALVAYASLGNEVFISSEKIFPYLLDKLMVKTDTLKTIDDTVHYLSENPNRRYNFPPYAEDKLKRLKSEVTTYFSFQESPYAEVLGYDKHKRPNFIMIRVGEGKIFLHSVPRAFANVNILDLGNYDYAFRCLSHLQNRELFVWDEVVKRGRVYNPKDKSGSILSDYLKILLSNEALFYGACILLVSFILYMIFKGKREQRIIYPVKPKVNNTLEFLHVLSNMYKAKEGYQQAVKFRHSYFLDFVRTKYFLNTNVINDSFIDQLVSKTKVSKSIIQRIFDAYNAISPLKEYEGNDVKQSLFEEYNRCLEQFYNTVKRENK